MPGDLALATRIQRALWRNPELSQREIEVTVRNGIATLKGTVPTQHDRLLAQAIASSFSECRMLTNKLTVEGENHEPHA